MQYFTSFTFFTMMIFKIFSSIKKFFTKKKKKNIRLIYSSEDCRIDSTGGPYEYDMEELNRSKK